MLQKQGHASPRNIRIGEKVDRVVHVASLDESESPENRRGKTKSSLIWLPSSAHGSEGCLYLATDVSKITYPK
jgi:hypothetical protein